MLYRVRRIVREIKNLRRLPQVARREYINDFLRVPRKDPGLDRAIDYAIAWLAYAQDKSASNDGGVAELYSLRYGWEPSYPETTGYIIPTMLAYAQMKADETVRQRAKRMLDWLVSIQFPDGSFQGGNIWAQPCVSTMFNTGQILIGLASGVNAFGERYQSAMCRAADWLVQVQDADGCWRKHDSPFVIPGEKAYNVHAVLGLLEAARIQAEQRYRDAAFANIRWALSQQTANGWFRQCCLDDFRRPLTHTLAYAWRGVLAGYHDSGDPKLLQASRLTGDSFLRVMHSNGFIPGRLLETWETDVNWECLTGTAQIAECFLLLYVHTGEEQYRVAGFKVNRRLRKLMYTTGEPEQIGGMKGSFPINGGYHDYNYINWACKFFIDANMLEKQIREKAL